MAITIPGAFLIIARYNRDKWNNLTELQQETAHKTAEVLFPEAREPLPQLRPEERTILKNLPDAELRPFRPLTLKEQKDEQLARQEKGITQSLPPEETFQALPREEEEEPYSEEVKIPVAAKSVSLIKGVRLVHSFHTGAFVEIEEKIVGEKQPEHVKVRLSQTDDIEEQKKQVSLLLAAPGTDTKDPGMGWIAVIDASSYEPFVEAMGGKKGPLWRMYDIEVIPLNNDRTTQDVYDFMTPVSWGK
jgi:hypothetical protein